MKNFQRKIGELLALAGSRKAFCEMTGVPSSSLSIWMTSDVEPSDLRKAQIAVKFGKPEDFFGKPVQTEPESKLAMTVKEASELLGCSEAFIHAGLQGHVFPWGYAVNRDGHWSYWINGPKLREVEGI